MAAEDEVQVGFGKVTYKDTLLFILVIRNTLYFYIDAGI